MGGYNSDEKEFKEALDKVLLKDWNEDQETINGSKVVFGYSKPLTPVQVGDEIRFGICIKKEEESWSSPFIVVSINHAEYEKLRDENVDVIEELKKQARVEVEGTQVDIAPTR